MSSSHPITMSPGETKRLARAVREIELVVKADIAGLICVDPLGQLSIIPAPGVGAELFRCLSQNDWTSLARVAEEWEA